MSRINVKNGKKTRQKSRGKPFQSGNPGRPKGSQNKFSQLKEAFLQAFEEIGGIEALSSWAKQTQNKGQFYQLISKLFPKEVEISGELDLSSLSNETLQALATGQLPDEIRQ